MADRAIGELDEALSINSTDLLVMEQDGAAKKVKGQTLENWLLKMANSHGGIRSIVKVSTSGVVDTYRITLSDDTTFDFNVTNGRSIVSVEKTSTNGLEDVYTIRYNDKTTSNFTVKNGAQGPKGDSTFVWIRYAAQKPTEASHNMSVLPDNWMGVYTGPSATAPTNWAQYSWFQIKGETGATGAAATLVSSTVEYQASEYGNVTPSGSWSSSVPNVPQGRYLWTRTTHRFNSGNPVITYTVSRMGMDGLGSVSSVCGVSPDDNGNVPLTADLIGALPVSGGQMQGTLNMADQKLTGLRTPEADTDAAPKSFVDKSVAVKADYVKAVQGEVITVSDSAEAPLQGLKVFGKTTQNGTPTPDAPVALESVGDGGSVTTTVCGKNLLDESKLLTSSGTGRYTENMDEKIHFVNTDGLGFAPSITLTLPPGTYYFGASIEIIIGTPYYGYYINDGPSVWGANRFLTLTEISQVTFRLTTDGTKEAGEYYANFWLTAGDTVTTYVPYTGTTATVTPKDSSGNSLHLPGIPVTSGGNYTDPITGKQWICDEVDFEKGVYVQRVGTVLLNGTQVPFLASESNEIYARFDFGLTKLKPNSNVFCDYFKPMPEDRKNVINTVEIHSQNGNILFRTDIVFTAEEMQTWFASNPTTVMAELAEPIEHDLTEEELAQYAAMHTNYPNTTVYNDAGAHMEVKYATPTSAIPVSGGQFGGPVNMCNNKLSGIPAPKDPTDAVPLSYAAQILETGMKYTDSELENIRSVPVSGTDDNGKILTVVNGVPTWVTIETWSGGSY